MALQREWESTGEDPFPGKNSWDLEGHKLTRGPAALMALHKELPATVSKKDAFL